MVSYLGTDHHRIPGRLSTYSEFNYYRNGRGECVLVEGASPLPKDTSYEQCDGYEKHWYERTAYRKIPYSSCQNGDRPDHGKEHDCPYSYSTGGHGIFFWGSVIILPFACAGLVVWWFATQQGSGCVSCLLSSQRH